MNGFNRCRARRQGQRRRPRRGRDARSPSRWRGGDRHGPGRSPSDSGPPATDPGVEAIQLDNLPISQHTFLDFITTRSASSPPAEPGRAADGRRRPGQLHDRRPLGPRHRQQRPDGRHEPAVRRDRGSQGPHLGLSGRIRPVERPAGLGRHAQRHQPVPRVGLRLRAQLRLERELLGRPGRTATPSTVNKQRDWGYTIGGPVGKPGGNNKLFFFYTHEFRPRTAGNNTNNYRMPTALERRGDFSQTLDNNGALYNLIYDASTGQPKTQLLGHASDGLLPGRRRGRADSDQPALRPGHGDAEPYPLPNNPQVAGTQLQLHGRRLPVQDRWATRRSSELDYQLSHNLRVTWKFSGPVRAHRAGRPATAGPARARLHRQHQQVPAVVQHLGDRNYTLNPTMFLEVTYGVNQNRLGTPISRRSRTGTTWSVRRTSRRRWPTARSARCRSCSRTPARRSRLLRVRRAASRSASPFFENGRILLPPQ